MATTATTDCAPEVRRQIRTALQQHPVAELGSLSASELNSLAALICALSEAGGAFRAHFERLGSRTELVALAASRGIPIEPSLLERFESLAGAGAAQPLGDRDLAVVSAGRPDLALQGLQWQLTRWLELTLQS